MGRADGSGVREMSEDGPPLTLRDRPQAKDCGQPPEPGEVKKTDSCLEPPEKRSPANTLI